VTERPVTERARSAPGNGNTLKTVTAVLALLAVLVGIGVLPRLNDLYTKTEAQAVLEKLDDRVTATEALGNQLVGKLDAIQQILLERLPAPKKRGR